VCVRHRQGREGVRRCLQPMGVRAEGLDQITGEV